MTPLRVGFAGTPAFAAEALAAILEAGYPVPLVLTQPDRPQGRGLRLAASPVKELAVRRAIPVLQPPTLKTPEGRAAALAVPVDVLVVAAYGLILPAAVLAWPRHGGINIHASKLPRWRGAAPIQRAILAGDAATGVTIMRMDEGLDTGPMLEVVDVPISPRETAGTLTTKLAAAGADAIVRVLGRLAQGAKPDAVPQPPDGATYAAKVGRDEARLDWTLAATTLDRVVRAFDPAPGAFTEYDGVPLKVWAAEPVPGTPPQAPGTVVAVGPGGVDVRCGDGVLRLATVQPAGGRRMAAAAFAAGRAVAPGARFGAAETRH
ncbi:MAG: methionyl-tRNA formyltransferase [Burkholderiales bacterium]